MLSDCEISGIDPTDRLARNGQSIFFYWTLQWENLPSGMTLNH